jgi:hypothetical protein
MGSVEAHQAGVASGVNNAVARTAGLLAIAVLGIVMTTTFNTHLDQRMQALRASPTVQQAIDAQREKLGAIDIPAGVSDAVSVALRESINESFLVGFRIVMLTAAGLSLACALCAALVIERKVGSVGEGEKAQREEKAAPEVG